MLNNALQIEIEQRLSGPVPGIDVLLVEQAGDVLRVYIDHPDGVTLGLCEQVTHELADLREKYALEVSSPGPQRPLTKPEHFRRFVGRRARVRTAAGCEIPASRNLTGELVAASADAVTIAAEDGVVAIPYSAIQRSHLVEE
ncbi:MAG TPA: ribosome maturation factor RimP [Solirubrobacteraceae bacterium]|jgi:ribosome maturation factor RimP|nr:ribosome maturation factor RimP [Solirubrobacteraceae bacterium]